MLIKNRFSEDASSLQNEPFGAVVEPNGSAGWKIPNLFE